MPNSLGVRPSLRRYSIQAANCIGLQIEGGQLGCFLLFAIELIQAGLEAIGEEKSHGIKQAAAATRCSEGLAEHGAFHQR
jgi:hypothetical protein